MPLATRPRGGDQQSRARHFRQTTVAQAAQPQPQRHQRHGDRMVGGSFAFDDRRFLLRRREVEIQRHEALPRAGLQVLQHALVALGCTTR